MLICHSCQTRIRLENKISRNPIVCSLYRYSFQCYSKANLSLRLQRSVKVILELSEGHILEPLAAAAKSLQSCPTLCDPIDGSPPGSPVPGILQARTLEWVAISCFMDPRVGQTESKISGVEVLACKCILNICLYFDLQRSLPYPDCKIFVEKSKIVKAKPKYLMDK